MKIGDMKLLSAVLAIVLLAGVLHWVSAPADQTVLGVRNDAPKALPGRETDKYMPRVQDFPEEWVRMAVDKQGSIIGDVVPLQVTDTGGLKAYGRYKGKLVKGWVPIAVDKEGRVIPSRQWVETELFQLDNEGRVICSPEVKQ